MATDVNFDYEALDTLLHGCIQVIWGGQSKSTTALGVDGGPIVNPLGWRHVFVENLGEFICMIQYTGSAVRVSFTAEWFGGRVIQDEFPQFDYEEKLLELRQRLAAYVSWLERCEETNPETAREKALAEAAA